MMQPQIDAGEGPYSTGKIVTLYNAGLTPVFIRYAGDIALRVPPESYIEVDEPKAAYLLRFRWNMIDPNVGINPFHPPACNCGCTPYVPTDDVLAEIAERPASASPTADKYEIAKGPTAVWSIGRIKQWVRDNGLAISDDSMDMPKLALLKEIKRTLQRSGPK